MVGMLSSQPRGQEFKFIPGHKFTLRFLLHLCLIVNSTMRSALTVHCPTCPCENEMARERTDHKPPYAKARKMKSLTLHNHGCIKDIFYELLFSF